MTFLIYYIFEAYMHPYKLFFLLYVICIIPTGNAETVVSYPMDIRTTGVHHYHNYFQELLQLSLEKTRDTFGNYKIIVAPGLLTPKRSIAAAEQDLYPNLVFEMAYDAEYDAIPGVDFILFPVDLGIMGRRVCFINPSIKETIKQARTLADLTKYTIGQGLNWVDSIILRHNGLRVREIDGFENIFKMLVGGRIDLFCHGSNQFLSEYNSHKGQMNLVYDETFELQYLLPRFFYLNSKNPELKQRIETGLKLAYYDRSLLKLWQKHFKESLDFANLPQRKIFFLTNPLLKDLSKDWEQYVYKPESVTSK